MTSPIQLPDVSAYRDLHQDILVQAVPAWLPTLSPAKRTALNNVKPSIPQWYKTASPDAHDTLKNRVSRAWEAQSKVDQAMGTLKSPQAFGAPLLAQLLKRRFGIERDVETTYLRLIFP